MSKVICNKAGCIYCFGPSCDHYFPHEKEDDCNITTCNLENNKIISVRCISVNSQTGKNILNYINEKENKINNSSYTYQLPILNHKVKIHIWNDLDDFINYMQENDISLPKKLNDKNSITVKDISFIPGLIENHNIGSFHFIKDRWDLKVIFYGLYKMFFDSISLIEPDETNFNIEEVFCNDHSELAEDIYKFLWKNNPNKKWEYNNGNSK